jgi:hypothetical protein
VRGSIFVPAVVPSCGCLPFLRSPCHSHAQPSPRQ